MALIPVELAGRSYEVRIGRGLLADIASEAAPFLRKTRVPIVADANAKAHWGAAIERSLSASGKEPHWYEVEPGEGSKSWESLAKLTDWLLAEGVERGDHVLALGGGVVGDLTGFACAYVAISMVKTPAAQGYAFFVGMVIAKFGPAWGMGVGIGLYILLLAQKIPGRVMKPQPEKI